MSSLILNPAHTRKHINDSLLHPDDMYSLFDILSKLRVEIKLIDAKRSDAIKMVETFARKYIDTKQNLVIIHIARAIVVELTKTSEITIDIIHKLINSYPHMPWDLKPKMDSPSEFEQGLEQGPEEEHDTDDEDEEEEEERRIAYMEKKTIACQVTPQDRMKVDLQCKELGLRIKQDQKEDILKCMMKFLIDSEYFPFSENHLMFRSCLIKKFMLVVQKYMKKSRTLDDLKVVERAIEAVGAEYLTRSLRNDSS